MFAGLLSKERSIQAWGHAGDILNALAPYSKLSPHDVWQSGRLLLTQVATQSGAKSANIYQHVESGTAVVFWGRIDNRTDLINQFKTAPTAIDDELIALAWLEWGEACPEHLIGEFALAIASPRAGTIFLARDVMGVKPLYYRADEDGVFFANSIAAFKPLQLGKMTPSPNWMAAFLIDMSYSHEETAYDEIRKLPGAHSLLIHADGRVNFRRYHRFIDDAPDERSRNAHWLEAYKAVWQESIACRLPGDGPIGCENSGGLDSGGITAEVARQLNGGIDRLHGMGFCYEALEPEYIMANAMRWGLKNNALFSHDVSFGLVRNRAVAVSGYPQEHGNGEYHYPFYERCLQNGIGTLLSGFGGDEGVTYIGGMPARLELLDQRNLHGLWRILPGPWPLRLARLAKTWQTGRHMPEFHAGFMAAWRARWPHNFLHPDALETYGLESSYFASATYDERFRKINDAVLYLLSRPFLPTRLEDCSLMAASYGVEYSWPLLDQRLVQQWLTTPAVWKVGDGCIGRYLHRRAIDGVCADKVTWKAGKDMGFAAVSSVAETADNRPLFRKALQLMDSVPPALAMIVDVARVRSMADRGIRQDCRGQAVRMAWSANIRQFELLEIWLRKS